MPLIWRSQALTDLRAVRDYIARDDPGAANGIAQRIRQAVMQLETFPQQGRPGRRQGTRELIVSDTPYIVVYRVRAGTIRILRIMHGRQRWP
jgi:toxin ParE1/3/4